MLLFSVLVAIFASKLAFVFLFQLDPLCLLLILVDQLTLLH